MTALYFIVLLHAAFSIELASALPQDDPTILAFCEAGHEHGRLHNKFCSEGMTKPRCSPVPLQYADFRVVASISQNIHEDNPREIRKHITFGGNTYAAVTFGAYKDLTSKSSLPVFGLKSLQTMPRGPLH